VEIINQQNYISNKLFDAVALINENAGYLTPVGIDMEKLVRFLEGCNIYLTTAPSEHGAGGGQNGQFGHFLKNDMASIQRNMAIAQKYYDKQVGLVNIDPMSLLGGTGQHYRGACKNDIT